MFQKKIYLIWMFFIFIGCGSNSLTGVDDERPLMHPIAKAGADRYIRTEESVTLDASDSNDSDGKIIAYNWSENNETLSTGIKLKNYTTSIAGIHTIILTVTDNDGLEDFDTVDINVSEKNRAPLAVAGDDKHIRINEQVTLEGNNSIDYDGKIIAYEWKEDNEVLSTGVNLKNYTTKIEGVHKIELSVLDNEGLYGRDFLFVFVVDNHMPIANAGNDQSISTEESVILEGNQSNDSDGEIVQYKWIEDTKILGTGENLVYESMIVGTHIIELTVTDNDGFKNSDTVIVIVSASNVAPIADAGDDKLNIHVGDKITLDGSNSYDADGTIIAYKWKDGTELIGTSSKLVNYELLSEGVHIIELTVVDNEGLSATDSVYVSVLSNRVPLADAGEDRVMNIGDKITLDASGSSDADGTIVSYEWKEGSKVLSTSSKLIDYSPSVAGIHTLTLTVTDDDGLSSSDSVYVNVVGNVAPVANAGNDQVLRLGQSITLDGSKSYDSDGTLVGYRWEENGTVLSTGVNLVNYSPTVIGEHIITLTVKDNGGIENSDTVKVTVSASNIAPIADAGEDKNISINEKVTLDGTQSRDIDGSIVSYEWKEGSLILSTGEKLIDYSSSVEGVHIIELTVKDNDGATHMDSVYIVVSGNIPPRADAGEDKTMRVGESVTLDGSASSDDSAIIAYEWKEGSDVLSTGEKLINYSSTEGTHTITLTVTDDTGLKDSDSVTVIIDAANIAPIADAGADQTIDVNETITLDGTNSSDSDGNLIAYEWKEGSDILSTGDKLRNYESNETGIHIIELKVTDNDGATDTDTVYVTVE